MQIFSAMSKFFGESAILSHIFHFVVIYTFYVKSFFSLKSGLRNFFWTNSMCDVFA